jgi:alanine-synthesizing transaminase
VTESRQSFSRRTAWDLTPNAFSIAKEGRELLDLTVSNPTVCGFIYEAESLLGPLANPLALAYDPDPRGLRSARESVAAYYADHNAPVDSDSILLTTSTSAAYSFLFRLLCDPGNEILVAQPSYPLFDFLATLDDVTLRPYPLFYDFGWWIAASHRRLAPSSSSIPITPPATGPTLPNASASKTFVCVTIWP